MQMQGLEIILSYTRVIKMDNKLYNSMRNFRGKSIKASTFFVDLALILFFLIFTILQFQSGFTMMERITFSVNGVVILSMFFRGLSGFSFSIDLIHSLFCLLFFWIAPIMQVSSKFTVWWLKFDEDDIIKANLFVLLWIACYRLGALWCGKKHWKTKKCSYSFVSKKLIFVILIIEILITTIFVYKNGLFHSSTSFTETDSRALATLVDNIVCGFMTFGTMIIIAWAKQNKRSKLFIALSIVCLVLSCFPTALSRYAAGSIYCCLLLTLMPAMRRKHIIVVILFFVMVIAFPIADLYRYKAINEVSFSDIINKLKNINEYFSTANYDAYQMIIAGIQAVEKNGHTHGFQMLGVILFFIPRGLWASKPVGTGAYIANTLGWEFSNIASPLLCEFYVDFGLFGIVVSAIFFGYIVSKIDNTYWQGQRNNLTLINVVYYFLVPYCLFLCRGSLLSTWAYLFAYIFVAYVLVLILRKTRGSRKKCE